jgi:hypothetical protein
MSLYQGANIMGNVINCDNKLVVSEQFMNELSNLSKVSSFGLTQIGVYSSILERTIINLKIDKRLTFYDKVSRNYILDGDII